MDLDPRNFRGYEGRERPVASIAGVCVDLQAFLFQLLTLHRV